MFNFLEKNQGLISLIGLATMIVLALFPGSRWYSLIPMGVLFVIGLFWIVKYLKKNRDKKMTIEEVRDKAKILFIDDKECLVVTSLGRNNFKVKKLNDIESTKDESVVWSNMIFIDYKGVGSALAGKKEGLGLINLLRNEYGSTKRYVIYSSVQDFDGVVDVPYIRKNANYDEFISIISNEVSKL